MYPPSPLLLLPQTSPRREKAAGDISKGLFPTLLSQAPTASHRTSGRRSSAGPDRSLASSKMRGKSLTFGKLAPAPCGVDCIRMQWGRRLTSPLRFHQAAPLPLLGWSPVNWARDLPGPGSSHSEQARQSTDVASQKQAISSNSSGAVIIS